MRRLAVPGLLIVVVVLVVLAVPFLPLRDPVAQDVAGRLSGSSAAHWLGQDEFGRDVLSRILWGARISLMVAVTSAIVAGIIGTLLGIFGGFFRGLVEIATVRVAEILLCFPPMLLALLVVTLVGPGVFTLILSLTILFAPGFARVAYAGALTVRALDYVTAHEAQGARPLQVLFRTLVPNIAAPLIVQFSLTVVAALLLESGLSFLGLGVVPPSPSWGLMVRSARGTMAQAPLLLLWPCLALSGAVLLLNIFCDRLRDVLDPRAGGRTIPGFLRAHSAMEPAPPDQPADETAGPLLSVQDLTLEVNTAAGPVQIVKCVSFAVDPGETVAIVGESGSGKTLTALTIMGLLPNAVRPVAGRVLYLDRNGVRRDLLRLTERELRPFRGLELAMVFQDPSSSFNPLRRVGAHLRAALRRPGPRAVLRRRVVELLTQVGLPDPERRAYSYPHELSGGQKQRVMIASAVASHPRLLIADEPTTALDVTIQAQILGLLAHLKKAEGGMGMIFVTHNLAVVTEIADRLVVMYAGEVVEAGRVADVFAAPKHPYTAALIACMPETGAERLAAIPGVVPQPHAMPPGCRFAPRCALAMEACAEALPQLASPSPGHVTRCLRWKELA